MRNTANISIRIFLTTLIIIWFNPTYGQKKCRIFNEYKNEIKIWASSTIDSLKRQGVDTILFYGVGVPNTGRVAYGKIIWASNGTVNKLEITSRYYDNAFHLSIPKYNSNANFAAIQFYSDYRLDTVMTNPKETFWMSHDFLHFVYSTIHGDEVCFIAEDYLLLDQEHLRSRWIKALSENVSPNVLCR
ncbi:MAG TPA: hypothetical protein VKC90_01625 [Chitinophagaceae bacterium]|nr:hypothetical protein [Chitinophagaceae bacterium]